MTLQFNVLATRPIKGSRTRLVIMDFFTRGISISALALGSTYEWAVFKGIVESEYVVRDLFDSIRAGKHFSILVDAGNPSVVHSFVEAKKNQRSLDIMDITLLRDTTQIESLSLSNVHVESFLPIDSGAYVAKLKLASGSVIDLNDKGLSYAVSLWRKNDNESKEDLTSKGWIGDETYLAGFDAQKISVPPKPPTREPLHNKAQAGHLFQLIKARKQLSMVVGGGPGQEYEKATHLFLEAQARPTLYDIQVLLVRGTNSIARLRLGKVKVEAYDPIEKGAYVARLKVTGGTADWDSPN